MTQPVQEPTTYRTLGKFGFGQRQLERRPATTSLLQSLPALKVTKSFSLSAGAQDLDDWSGATFSFSSDFFTSPTGDPPLGILEPGLYLFFMEFQPSALGAQDTWADGTVKLELDSGGTASNTAIWANMPYTGGVTGDLVYKIPFRSQGSGGDTDGGRPTLESWIIIEDSGVASDYPIRVIPNVTWIENDAAATHSVTVAVNIYRWSGLGGGSGGGGGGAHVFTMARKRDMTTPQTVGAAAWTTVSIGGDVVVNQDTGRFDTGSSANAISTLEAGRYGFLGKVRWDPLFNFAASLAISAGGVWTYFPTVTYHLPGAGADNGNVMMIYLESDIPAGSTSFGLQIRQESAGNQTIVDSFFQITWLGDFTDMGTAYDDF